MSARSWQEPVAYGLTALVFTALTLPPFAAAALALWAEDIGPTLEHLSSGQTWRLFLRSLLLAGAITTLATFVGAPLGFLLGRTDVRGRGAALALHLFPLALPPFLLGLGWFHLFGRSAPLGSESSAALLFSSVGAALVLALALAPIVSVLTALALQSVEASLVEAARVVAPPWRVELGILLPLAAPSIGLGAWVVFALAFSELGVPSFLGVSTYPVAVFARLGGLDYAPGEAFALALPLLALALVLVAIERAWLGARPLTVAGLRRERTTIELKSWRGPLSVAVWATVLVPLLPLAGLLTRAFPLDVAQLGAWMGRSVSTSLLAAAAAATAITVLGLVLGSALARTKARARILDTFAILAFVTPAALFGVGVIATWNHSLTASIYGSIAILVIASAGRYAVLGLRPLSLAIRQRPVHLEEAAAVFGASFLSRVGRIVLPLHVHALAATWLLCFIFCLRDLDLGVLFYPPGGETLPIRIFTLEANGPEPIVAGLALLQVGLTAIASACAFVLLGRLRTT